MITRQRAEVAAGAHGAARPCGPAGPGGERLLTSPRARLYLDAPPGTREEPGTLSWDFWDSPLGSPAGYGRPACKGAG